MSNKLNFGRFEGKTYEWIFFKAPWYVRWMIDEQLHRQEHLFSKEEGDYFRELYDRACHLTGTCQQCEKRPTTRMCLITQHRSWSLSGVGFFCDECEYMGGSRTNYIQPSFFLQ